MAVKAQPDGYHAVTPTLVVDGAAKVIDFATRTFGAQERMRMPTTDGKIAHAELEVGDSVIMVSDPMGDFPAAPGYLHVYVDDCDSVFKKALAAGGKSQMEPKDEFYGDRVGNVIDPCGNRWTISTHIEDVSEAEMEKRMAAMAPA